MCRHVPRTHLLEHNRWGWVHGTGFGDLEFGRWGEYARRGRVDVVVSYCGGALGLVLVLFVRKYRDVLYFEGVW